MCKHLEDMDCFQIEKTVKTICPWCEMDELVKKIKELKQKLIDERETSGRVHKENLELQEQLDRLGEL